MNRQAASVFETLRPRLQGLAYRMLGTLADAEEVVQDAWLRWHEAREPPDNDEAWLVTVTTRLAIDRLRLARTRREHYVGTWLPEPWLSDLPSEAPSAQDLLERADDLSVAFLLLLETLGPEMRAAFLLREVFDVDYAEVARTLEKTEASCRQLVSRARTRLRSATQRPTAPPERQRRLLQDFVAAVIAEDLPRLQALLANDAVLLSDGGGKVSSFPLPLIGAARISRLFRAIHRRHGTAWRAQLRRINGQWALVVFHGGALESVRWFETDGTHITRIWVQRNPDKLVAVTNQGADPSSP